MPKRVLIGMSGGVDSTVSALLLKKAGYEVIGATMKLWEQNCNESQAVIDAQKICKKIGIEHHIIDSKEEFNEKVVNNFICEYSNARTPNPCIECNKYLKFGVFYKKALELNCDYVATGHYARVEYSEQYKQYVLKKSDSEKKDQTYFLYGINKDVLHKILFPLENYKNKEEVRKIANQNNLEVAEKSDSQEVCFIPDNNYADFICKYTKQKKGNIVLNDGTILGKHNGLINYTIGQRKGLGIAYKSPLYVLQLNTKTNEVIVGPEEELYSNVLHAHKLNFLLDIQLDQPIKIKAKVRFRAEEAEAILYPPKNGISKVEFTEPQRAITPGQSVVFYIGDIVLGGGKIM